jgi:hypothetical protein
MTILTRDEIFALEKKERGIPQAREMARVLDSHETLRAEVVRLKALLDKDHTGLVQALKRVVEEINSREWVEESRGPYAWDDERYKAEAGDALRRAREIAKAALLASMSVTRVEPSLHPKRGG